MAGETGMGRRGALALGLGLASAPALAQARTEISFWHYQTANIPALREVLAASHEVHPEIRVTDVPKDVGTIATEVQAAALARRPPDVGQILARLTVGLVRNAGAVPLDSGEDRGAFLNTVLPRFREVGILDGKPYAVPHSFGTPLLDRNKSIFTAAGLDPEKAPADWDEVVATGRQIRERTGRYAIFISQGGRDVSQQQMMVNAGATMLSPDLSRATFANPGAIAAMQLWQDMAVTHRIHATLSEREQTSLLVPLLSPTIYFVAITSVLFTAQQVFTPINIMTGGGPADVTTNLFYLAYEMAFESFNIGFASATALLLFVGLGALAALKAWLIGRRVHYA